MIQVINKCWKGTVEINGSKYTSNSEFKPDSDNICIKLYPNTKKLVKTEDNTVKTESSNTGLYQIKVKAYMTKKATPEFDFMQKWNNDNPMPLRIMVGEKVKETRGMVYMKLHGDIIGDKVFTCMKCGRPLKNPISQYFGIGPECGSHNYVNPFESDEELKGAVNSYKKELQNIKWEGWIIKSAIEDVKEV